MNYLKDLLKGEYGDIKKKHKDLARVIKSRNPKLDNIPSLIRYCKVYKKYNNFTYRDFDKALALSTK